MAASADASFKCSHASLELYHLHVKCGLFAAECRDLLLEAGILLLLMCEVSLNVLLHLEKLVGQGLSHVLGL